MKQRIYLLCILISFTACNQSATSVFKKDPIYAQNIQYTKILKVIDKDKRVDVVVNITYLNSTNNKKYNDGKQNFLVGIYSDIDNANEYTLSLNNTKSISISKIDKSHYLYKNIAFRNNWATYYIYTFNDIKNNNLVLTYNNSKVGFDTVAFEKE